MPHLTLFNPETASDAYFRRRHEYQRHVHEEEKPDDPHVSLDFSIKNAQSWRLVESVKVEAWHLWDQGKIFAELFLTVDLEGDNAHIVWLGIQVLRPYRRKGYTASLLKKALEFGTRFQRTLILGSTTSFVPEGQGFAERLGATQGSQETINQLELADIDKKLLLDWLTLGDGQAHEFELGFWGDRYPEEEIGAIAALMDVMNTAPRDDLQLNDEQTEPQELREQEAYDLARSIERWVLYARHKASHELAGFTATTWFPENPENLGQGGTGVLTRYRGYGLGKWLKAAMIQKVLTERPGVKRIRTGNATSNVPMLAINHKLGFKFYESEIIWQLEMARLASYLTAK